MKDSDSDSPLPPNRKVGISDEEATKQEEHVEEQDADNLGQGHHWEDACCTHMEWVRGGLGGWHSVTSYLRDVRSGVG